MAAGSVDVAVRFVADASKVESEAAKVEGVGGKLKGFAKTAGLAIGGAFAVNAVTDWIGAAEEANAVSAGLAQSLSNAGDATGDWTRHAEELAGTLQAKTGIDDEVIKGAQTILGTFHDLAGATGQQSGAFDRATKASLDMSKAGFGSAESAATMLGKALEDPEKGLTALGKVGVTFTDAQKEQIKAMVASGDQAGAMGKILENVEGQVGGIAEKTVTSGDKMKVAWGETQESLGNALLPVLEAIAPVLQNIARFVQENTGWLIPLAATILAVVAAIKVWTIVQTILNAVLAANPIVLIVLALAALVAGLILAYQNCETFRNIVDAALHVVASVFVFLWDTIKAVFSWVAEHWPLLLAILTGPFGIAVLLIVSNWERIKGAIGSAIDWIRSVMSTLGEIIAAPFRWASDRVGEIVGGIKTAFDNAISFVKDVANVFIRAWNSARIPSFTIGGWDLPGPLPDVPSFDTPSVGFPHINELAAGGIVKGATLALLGERGPEAVIPLDRMAGGVTINLSVTAAGLGADAPQIQSAVVDALRGYVRRNGPISGIAG